MLPRVNLVRTAVADYLLLSTHDALTMELYRSGDYSAVLKAVALAWCKGQEKPFIMDIGANLGAFSVPLAKDLANVGGTVFCYEPQRIIFYQLCGNIFLNRLDNCHAMHLAIGSSNEVLEISEIDYLKSSNIGGYSLHKDINRSFPYVSTTGSSHPVQVLKLDSITTPRVPSLIKIDVEGFELNVLKGGEEFFRRNGYPFLMIECWQAEWYADRRKIILDYLSGLGYHVFVFEEDLLAQHVSNTRFVFEYAGAGRLKMTLKV